MREQRRLAAILAADVVGYSRQTGRALLAMAGTRQRPDLDLAWSKN